MKQYTTNQPIGRTAGNTKIFSTGANPPAHQGTKWQTEPEEQGTLQNLADKTGNVLAKCEFCGRRFMTTEGGALREDGMLVSRCAHCKKVEEDEPLKRNLEQQLCDVLMNHTGEHGQNEGAVECLKRIIRERDLLLKRAIEDMLKPVHY